MRNRPIIYRIMNKFQKLLTVTGLFALFFSCDTDGDFPITDQDGASRTEIIGRDVAIKNFAVVLSRAVYARQDVREFLKTEAAKKFDGNTDILYGAVKNLEINEVPFRDILMAYSTEKEIIEIERAVPELNIFIPEIAIFDITVDNLDCADSQIPVAVFNDNGTDLFLNGKVEITIPKGELPDFHSFVVNENNFVKVYTDSNNDYLCYKLLSTTTGFKSQAVCNDNLIGDKALKAFEYFCKTDESCNSQKLQRDYIYYGITPDNETGQINYGVSEYLGFLEVDPKAFFSVKSEWADKDRPGNALEIIKAPVSGKGKSFTKEYLVSKIWSQGVFTFRFEVFNSTNSAPLVSIVNLYPEDLWDFNLIKKYGHGTLLSRSKSTYKIDPEQFTAKRVDLGSREISLGGKWDLSQEALERYISVFEENPGKKREYRSIYKMSYLNPAKINGAIKYGLGTNTEAYPVFEPEASTELMKTFNVYRSEDDDILGNVKVCFYDPLLLGKTDDGYIVQSYNTGVVNFGIMVK